MAHNYKPGGGYSHQQQHRGPSPRLNSSHQQQMSQNDSRNLIQTLNTFIRHLNDEPSAIPEEQYRLNSLIQPLKSDASTCTDICQHLWKCCLNSRGNLHHAGGDQNSSNPSLSTYDFARICQVLVTNTTNYDISGQQQTFFKALLRLCSNNFEEFVKPFLERHDTKTAKFDKNSLKLVLQLNADLISQMDSLPLLKSAMFIIIRACYSITHVQDRCRDAPALSEELVFTAATSVLRVAGPKIDDPTIVAHLLKDYAGSITHELKLWEEIFMQIRGILMQSNSEALSYSTRVKTQLLALLEARAGYWGMLSSQYAAMQACASAYVTGDPQAYGAACAEYYTTFGNGLSTASSNVATAASDNGEDFQIVSNFMGGGGTQQPQQQHQQPIYAENSSQAYNNGNYYYDPSVDHNNTAPTRPSTLNATVARQPQHSDGGGGGGGADDYEQYLRLSGLPPDADNNVDDIDAEAEAEFEKFQSGEGAYTGDDDDVVVQSMSNLGLSNGSSATHHGGGGAKNDDRERGGGEPSSRFG